MKIEVLGSGCKKCTNLANDIQKVADSLKIEMELVKVTDMVEIAAYGVMSTPAIVIDGKVVTSGHVPSEAELALLLSQANQA